MKINTKIMVRLALFAAISIVLGKFLSIKIVSILRISFENLSVILAGYVYGPLAGALCGAVADILGCIMYGYSINPIITLGAVIIGCLSGLFGMKGISKCPNLALSVASSHLIGSIIVKSIGLYVYYPPERYLIPWRIPIYIAIAVVEFMLIRFCLNHRGIKELL